MLLKKDTISVKLTASGALAVVSIPVNLNKDSYKVTRIQCLVPKIENATNKSFVKIYANTIDISGNKTWGSQTYNLPFEKNIVIDGFEHEIYQGDFPEEFCKINGSLEITFAYGTLNENDEFLSRLPSSTLNLYIGGNGYNPAGVVVAQHDVTAAKVNELSKNKVDKVESEEGRVLVADGAGGMKPSILPVNEYEDQKAYIDTLDAQKQAQIDLIRALIDTLQSDKADRVEVLAEINNAISTLIGSAPESFDTLKEIADWIEKDESGTSAIIERLTNLEENKVDWDKVPSSGIVLYDSSGDNENGAMSQKATTDEINKKVDKFQGEENANKNLITNTDGEIETSDGVYLNGYKLVCEIVDGGDVEVYLNISDDQQV